MHEIQFSEFERVELRAGTIIKVEEFPQARKPAYKIWVDFGEFGIKQSSAQVTVHYTPATLLGRQIMGVINFPPKNIAGFKSEFLITGFADTTGAIVLVHPERSVPNGAKLC
ncbi:MAG: tRNA-binding protein [Oligoflexia bacterium]|nr:tRNA-binding protein [Oligoflexia bacterium]